MDTLRGAGTPQLTNEVVAAVTVEIGQTKADELSWPPASVAALAISQGAGKWPRSAGGMGSKWRMV